MPWYLYALLFVYFIFCVLLMGVILIQSGKGEGLSSLGASAGGLSDALGSTGVERTLNKITTGIAVGFFFLVMILSLLIKYNVGEGASKRIFEDAPAAPAPAGAMDSSLPPGAPAAAPEASGAALQVPMTTEESAPPAPAPEATAPAAPAASDAPPPPDAEVPPAPGENGSN